MSTQPHVDRADRYAEGVLSGKIPACWQIRAVCERYINDQRKAKSKNPGKYEFDVSAAEKACRFVEAMPHVKGKWAAQGASTVLEDWQCFFVVNIFGWVNRKTRRRRYRKALLFVPRKNGKSFLAAAIGLYMLSADNEYGAEVYSGATSEKQAHEVFGPAWKMAQKAPYYAEHFGVEVSGTFKNPRAIYQIEDGGKFEPVIGQPGDGASPSCAIVDEYHEHKTDALYDTMLTGMGARDQPLMLVTTTAGSNLGGPCYALQKDAEKVLQGVAHNDELFAMIFTVDKDDDWADPESLKKANPNYGVSVNDEYLISQQNEAKSSSRKQSTFQTKHLNIWVGSKDAFYNVRKWQQCADDSLRLEDFIGERCIIAVDLASKIDIAALEILLPRGNNHYIRFGRYYLPRATVDEEKNEHYRGWENEGRLIVTDGEIIDFNRIKEDILWLCSKFQVEELAYDPHQATKLVTELMDEGVPVVEMRPTVLNFSEPMKELEGLILSRKILHDDDPIATWMISNVVAKYDNKDNVYPNKERPESKIDMVVALLMALGRAMVSVGPRRSIYEDGPI